MKAARIVRQGSAAQPQPLMLAKPSAPQHRAAWSEAKPARSVRGFMYSIGANALISR
jgi:hypothetical protein